MWPWTVSYEAVNSSNAKYLVLHSVALLQAEQRSCNRKPVVHFELTKRIRETVAALIMPGHWQSKHVWFLSRAGTNEPISLRKTEFFMGG